MQPDDLMPNDGTWFYGQEPTEQTKDRNKEKAKTLEALTIVKEFMVRLDERIAFRDSLQSINVDLEKDPALHQKMCEVNDLLKLALIEEKGLFEDLLDTHA